MKKAFLLLLFCLVSTLVQAEKVPSTSQQEVAKACFQLAGGGCFSSAEGVCSRAYPGSTVHSQNHSLYGMMYSCKQGDQTVSYSFQQGADACYTKEGEAGRLCQTVPTCPDSTWILSTDHTYCERANCLVGETRQPDGTCLKECPEGTKRDENGICKSVCVAGEKTGTSSNYIETSSTGSLVCAGGCEIRANTCLSMRNPSEQWYRVCWGPFSKTGNNCTAGEGGASSEPTPLKEGDPKTKCAQQGMASGTVNGVVVCVKAGESESSSESSSSEKTETKDKDGNMTGSSGGDSNSKTDTKCVGDKCTSTTTSTGAGGDGSSTKTTDTTTCEGDRCTTEKKTETKDKDGNTTTGTQTSDETKSEFCKKNPKHALCTGEDKEPKFDIPKKGKFEEKTKEVDELKTQFSNKVKEIQGGLSGMFGTLSTGAGSLPCGERFTVLGQSINFCFSQYNDKLSIIGSVMILIAWVLAAGIVLWR